MIDTYIYESQTCKTVSFGRKGENLARRIMFDLSALIAEFGAGTFEWVIRRPHESTVYIAVNKEQDGNTAILNLTTTETAISGYGGLELRYYVDDAIVKTIVWRTSIAASLGGGDVPDPIEDYIDQMREIAQEASESADAAGDSATQAAVSATNAAGSATEAAGYDANAAASAGAAADSATNSAASATAAYTSEVNAANSATQASDFAIQAANSASAASGSASQAASSVTQAAGSASAAANSATQAAQSATAATQSATAANQSAQDIAASSAQIETNRTDITDLKNGLSQNAIPIVSSASGAIASFSDGADDVPVKDLVVNIEPVQEGTGDPSPDNVRPISGWTGLKLTRTAKNIFGGTLMRDGVLACVPSAIDYSDDESVRFASNAVANTGGFTQDCGLTGKFKENTSYTFIITYAKGSSVGSNMRIWYSDGTYTAIPNLTDEGAKETKVVVTPSNKTVSSISKMNQSSATRLYYNESGIFEGDLTADDFVPYDGQTYNVDWTDAAGTVYGGQLNVTTGVLTVDRYMITLDGTQGSWNAGAGIPYWRFNPVSANKPAYSKRESIISNQYNQITGGSSTDKAIRVTSDNNGIYVYDSRLVDSATAVSLMSESPVEICYPLLTAKTYQLTPTEVNTLLKQNNIFADTGDIASVEYVADTKTYIDNKFAELQALILENA